MRIITLNANGIRSAAAKGLFEWLPRQKADVICMQETRAQAAQLTDRLYWPKGYHCYYFDAEKKGYAGTAVYSRKEPVAVRRGFGVAEFDREGRYLEADFGPLSVVSLYLPSGSSGPQRQESKFRFLEAFLPHLKALGTTPRPVVLCGDWNIAHKPIDLKNWKSNQKNSGFLPEERQWLDLVFDTHGFVDAFREINPKPEQYTWWSNRGRARENNVGWRIDYQITTAALRGKVGRAKIYTQRRFSDHAPLIIDYDIEL